MKNRRVFALLIGLLVSLLFSLNAFSQGTVVRVAPRPLETLRDAAGNLNPITVDIVIENGQDVVGYLVVLQFHHGFLTFDGIQQGDYLAEGEFVAAPISIPTTDSLTEIIFGAVSTIGENSKGDGVLATLTFNSVKAQASDLTLLEGTALYNKDVEESFPQLEHSQTYPKLTDSNPNKITVITQPDLKITSIKAGQKGAYPHAMKKRLTVAPEGPFDLLINIFNEGERDSDEIKVRFYRSEDTQISTSDSEIEYAATEIIEKVGPGALLEDIRSRVWAPDAPGTYYYGACVDTVASEKNPDNNCSAAVTVIVPGLWKGFISQVAHSADGYTYFVVNPPHFVNVPGLSLLEFDVKACSVTLDTPDSGYFMFPLDTPKGQRTVENLQKVDKSIKFGYSILGVLPKSWITEGGLLSKLKAGVVGTVLTVVSIVGNVINTVIEVVNPEDPTAPPTLTVTPSDGAWKTFRNLFIDKLLELENYEYEPFLPPMLFVIREDLSSIDITVKQVYNIHKDVPDKGDLTYTYTQRWDLKGSTAAAPNARPMSLADYPPFQSLPPEVQEYLHQHFSEFESTTAINREAWQIPQETFLLSNYPNPFNPETWIPYQLADPADVTLTIYDIQGRAVRILDLGHQRAGTYHDRSRAAYWDGKNAVGEPVASGAYFYTLKAGDFTATRKMLIQK